MSGLQAIGLAICAVQLVLPGILAATARAAKGELIMRRRRHEANL